MDYCSYSERFIRIGRYIPAILRSSAERPEKGRDAIMFMHSDEDYLDLPPAIGLARLGYTTLAANSPEGTLEEKMNVLGQCIELLRGTPGVERVFLFGHSGGATLASAYQAVAEKGADVFRGGEMFYRCGSVAKLVPADGVILVDSNWGNGSMTLMSMDPNYNGQDEYVSDPELDMFRPENGYAPEGSTYSREFVERFCAAQGRAMNCAVKKALDRLTLIQAGKGRFNDDEPFVIPGGSQFAPNNKLFPEDIRYLAHTKRAHTLVHADLSETEEVVPSLRRPSPGMGMYPAKIYDCAVRTTVRRFLSNAGVWTDGFGYDETGVYGIDFTRFFSNTPGNVRFVNAPALVVGLTGGYESMAAEGIFDAMASVNKTLAYIEGATHNFTPNQEMERYPGQFGDTNATLCSFIDKWIGLNR